MGEKLKQAQAEFGGDLESVPEVRSASPALGANELLQAASQGSDDQDNQDDDGFFGSPGASSS